MSRIKAADANNHGAKWSETDNNKCITMFKGHTDRITSLVIHRGFLYSGPLHQPTRPFHHLPQ